MRSIAFRPRDPDGLVRRPGKHTRVTVESATDLFACAYFDQHRFNHLAIGIGTRLAVAIQRLQAAHVAVHLLHPQFDDRIGHRDKHDIGILDVTPGERADVRTERHPDTDACETSGAPGCGPRALQCSVPCEVDCGCASAAVTSSATAAVNASTRLRPLRFARYSALSA
jgi:hypothetical protein